MIGRKYPQVCFPIDRQTRESDGYKNAVLRGKRDGLHPRGFTFSAEDMLSQIETSAGLVDVLYVSDRADFERCVQMLAYRCEPRAIPPSMGATTVIGLINWEKIDCRKAEYLLAGGSDWKSEFKRFTADPTNCRDALIIVGKGYYSAVPPKQMGLTEDEWLEKSLVIRINHELTHFVFRKRFPDDVDAIRDEVIADAVGLMTAFGRYNPEAARRFLGIETDHYRKGGRLENYLGERLCLKEAVLKADELIGRLSDLEPFSTQEIGFEKSMESVLKVFSIFL